MKDRTPGQTIVKKTIRIGFVQNTQDIILYAHDVTHFQQRVTIEQNFVSSTHDVKNDVKICNLNLTFYL